MARHAKGRHSAKGRPRSTRARRRRTGLQRAVLALNLLACMGCVATAAAITWSWQRIREIPRIELGEQLASDTEGAGPTGQAQNFLLIGTDSADGLPEDDPVLVGRDAGTRTDTLIVVRLDPSTQQAAIMSIPRDLYVRIAGTRGSGRINSALFGGGPARLIDTINEALDIPIHHYIEVDFEGFRDLVDAVGGVPIYFPEPVRDRRSGLNVPNPGCVTLDPVQALAYARSRHYEVQRNGRWVTDGTSDFGRISRQQDFIRRVLARAFQRGARNPAVLADLVTAGVGSVTLDGDLTTAGLIEFGNEFRRFDPNQLISYQLPVFDDIVEGEAILRLATSSAQDVLDVFRGQDPDRIATDNTVVQVLNGTSSGDLGEDTAEALRAFGFVIPPDNVEDATSFDEETTTILYLDGNEERAFLLASALRGPVEVDETDFLVGADVALQLGADFPGVVDELAVTSIDPDPDDVETTTTLDPDTSTSTTAPLGEVPQAPPGVSC